MVADMSKDHSETLTPSSTVRSPPAKSISATDSSFAVSNRDIEDNNYLNKWHAGQVSSFFCNKQTPSASYQPALNREGTLLHANKPIRPRIPLRHASFPERPVITTCTNTSGVFSSGPFRDPSECTKTKSGSEANLKRCAEEDPEKLFREKIAEKIGDKLNSDVQSLNTFQGLQRS
jgi:hypothetical protein